MRSFVSASPRNIGERSITHKGNVNSNAMTCAKGDTVTAKNNKFCPVKCAIFLPIWDEIFANLYYLKFRSIGQLKRL